MIRAYPHDPSVRPGEALTLCVSTDAPAFRVAFFRQGAELEPMGSLGREELVGADVPDGPAQEDWGWPPHRFEIPADWPAGAYVAMLGEVRADGSVEWPDLATTAGDSAKALFVVRSREPLPILYKLSWATFHAYNATGYGSLYGEAQWSREAPQPGFKVTTRRPGGGAGGRGAPNDPPDAHDPSSRRQTFAHWDAPFIAWLERHGYAFDLCTDLDLHRDPSLLDGTRLLLSVGHDEYWSDAMRDHVEAHVRRGGNVAFLSGNIAGFRIHFADDDSAIVCAKVGPHSRDADRWQSDEWRHFEPENGLTGVSIHNAGGWWDGWREPLGYTVQHACHWAFDGTGLEEGEVLGADADHPLVGYECDGAEFTREEGLAIPTGGQGTPESFFILGVAELGEGWFRFRPGGAATMGVYTTPRGGIVFQGATVDWPVAAVHDAAVGRVTRNVLDRLSLATARVVGPLPARGGRMLAAEGEVASFHVDLAGLPEGAAVVWEAAGAEIAAISADGLRCEVGMPSPRQPVTVSATVSQDDIAIAFGTTTFLPLTEAEALRLDAGLLIRELAAPGEPASSLTMPTRTTLSRSGGLSGAALPRLRETAARLAAATERLAEHDGEPAPRVREEAR